MLCCAWSGCLCPRLATWGCQQQNSAGGGATVGAGGRNGKQQKRKQGSTPGEGQCAQSAAVTCQLLHRPMTSSCLTGCNFEGALIGVRDMCERGVGYMAAAHPEGGARCPSSVLAWNAIWCGGEIIKMAGKRPPQCCSAALSSRRSPLHDSAVLPPGACGGLLSLQTQPVCGVAASCAVPPSAFLPAGALKPSWAKLGGYCAQLPALPTPFPPCPQMLAIFAPGSLAAEGAMYLQGAAKERWEHNATAADPLFNQAQWAEEGSGVCALAHHEAESVHTAWHCHRPRPSSSQ